LGDLEPLSPDLSEDAAEGIADDLRAAWSDNTRRAYGAALSKLTAWVELHHPETVRADVVDSIRRVLPLHPVTLMDFLERVSVPDRSEDGAPRTRPAATSTLALYLAAVRAAHRYLDLPDPTANSTFERFWRGLRRRRGTGQAPKRAARWPLLRLMIDAIDQAGAVAIRPWRDRRLLLRDRALLLVGFSGAFRRSELVGLRRRDVRLPAVPGESVILIVRQSKSSDEPTEVEIPSRDDKYSPADSLRLWLDVITGLELPHSVKTGLEAPIWFGFRGPTPVPDGLSAGSVAAIVKRAASQAGLDQTQVASLSAHSLRSGAATSAAEAGESLLGIKDLGRWRGLEMVDRYVQRRQRGREHPVARME